MIGISRRYVPAAKPLIKKVSGKKIIVNVSAAISPLTTPRIFRFRAAENALIKAPIPPIQKRTYGRTVTGISFFVRIKANKQIRAALNSMPTAEPLINNTIGDFPAV